MEEDYTLLFETLGLDETALAASPEETLRLPEGSRKTIESLPPIDLSSGLFEVGSTLGEGGMGLVRGAVQLPFGRTVALKSVRPELSKREDLAHGLLREAIAAGRLEHPNVVPIYAVGRGEDGSPVIVMKRIEGSSWRDHIAGMDPAAGLERNLEIFQQVCSAAQFAHAHGIIHRDIKPENVMLGNHDDVYLVDWGLAVTLSPDTSGQLPSAADSVGLCGTPMYMAPEMASGGQDAADVRTDVYLLGATLHELVTGAPRHQGSKMFEILRCAYLSEPVEYPNGVPLELAAICNRATARNPDDRFQSAAELRTAVRQFIAHRHAAALAEDAQEQLQSLREALGGEAAVDARRVAVYRHYGAARFGFERSLAEWPEQAAAVEGLQATLETMIGWELAHGSTHAAAALLADLPRPNPSLVEAVREVEHALERERAEVEALRERDYQLDGSVGARTRAAQIGLIIVGGLFLPVVANVFLDFPPWFQDPFALWMVALVTCLATIGLVAIGWRRKTGIISVAPTQTNRRIALCVVIICVFLIVFRGVTMWSGVPIPLALTLELIAFGMATATLATFVDGRLGWSAAIYLGFAGGILMYPQYDTLFYVVASSGALAWVMMIWKAQR